MRAVLDSEARSVTVVFADKDVARAYLNGVRTSGGLLVALDRKLSQYDVVRVDVEVEGTTHEAFRSYAARITGGPGSFETALVVQDWSEDSERRLLKQLDRRQDSVEDPQSEPLEAEVRGVAAVHRLKQMNPGQKAIHAQRAGRAERQVLLRDNAPQVLQGLLVNPRVEAPEILRIAKSTYATGAILQRIAGDSRWGKNQEILAAVVRNPKSPTMVVTRLVDKLRTSDLRQMAKMSSGLKEVVRKAALREYMKRSGQ